MVYKWYNLLLQEKKRKHITSFNTISQHKKVIHQLILRIPLGKPTHPSVLHCIMGISPTRVLLPLWFLYTCAYGHFFFTQNIVHTTFPGVQAEYQRNYNVQYCLHGLKQLIFCFHFTSSLFFWLDYFLLLGKVVQWDWAKEITESYWEFLRVVVICVPKEAGRPDMQQHLYYLFWMWMIWSDLINELKTWWSGVDISLGWAPRTCRLCVQDSSVLIWHHSIIRVPLTLSKNPCI